MSSYVSVGCRPDGTKKPFQILCGGSPFAGYETEKGAMTALLSYAAPRPKNSYEFVVTAGGQEIKRVRSEVKVGAKSKAKR